MGNRLCLSFLMVVILVVSTVPCIASDAKKSVTVGVLLDGKSTRGDEFVGLLASELKQLLGSRYVIDVPVEKILEAGWSGQVAGINYAKLVKDPDVDIIVGAGIVTGTVIAAHKTYKKPVILMGIIDPGLQGVKLGGRNKTHINNFTCILFDHSIERDLDLFYSIYPYKKVGIAASHEFLKVAGMRKDAFKDIMKKNSAAYIQLPAKHSIADVLGALGDVDAVYLGYMGRFEGPEKQRLIQAINQRKLPTFGDTVIEVENGVLAAAGPERQMLKLIRRIALDIEAYLSGENLSSMPVRMGFEERLTLNMQTAHKIGFSPRFTTLSKADQVFPMDEEGQQVISLPSVMKQALQSSLDVAISATDVDTARKEVALARSNYFPIVTAGGSGVVIDRDVADISSGTTAERTTTGVLSIEQLVFSEEQTANMTAKQHLLDAARYGFKTAQLDAVLDAAVAYFSALKAKTALYIQKENVELTRKHLAISKQRQAVGYSGPSDVYRWESSLASATTDLLEAKNNYRLSKILLNQKLNRPLSQTFALKETLLSSDIYESYIHDKASETIDTPALLKKYTEFLIDEALKNASEIKNQKAGIAAAERELASLRRKRFVPVVGISAEGQHVFAKDGIGTGTGTKGVTYIEDLWSASLNFSWPLYSGGATDVKIRKSRIEIRRLKTQLEKIKQGLEFNVRSAVLDAVVKWVNLESSARSADLAKKSLNLVQDAYSKGSASIVDLADAQNSALNAELGALNAVYSFMESMTNAERAVGFFRILATKEQNHAFEERFKSYFSAHP